MTTRHRLPFPLALALLLAGACLPSVAPAGNGLQVHLPVVGMKNRSGLRMMIDGCGVDANGYRPVKIVVTSSPPAPLTADRQIRVVLKPNAYAGVSSPTVAQIIELPEGSITTTATVSMPQTSMWHGVTIETYEGGQKWEELSQRYMAWSRTNTWDWSEARPTMLFIDSDVPQLPARLQATNAYRATAADPTPTHNLPDVRTLVWLFPDPNTAAGAPQTPGGRSPVPTAPRATDVMLLTQVHDLPRVEFVAPDQLPTRWIDLSQFDIAVISLADLQAMAAGQKQQHAALCDWLATGPLLIVYGVGDDFAQLAEVEKLLALSPFATADNADETSSTWTRPDAKSRKSELLTPFSTEYRTAGVPFGPRNRKQFKQARTARVEPERSPTQAEEADPATAAGALPPFLFRRAGTGVVAAIAADNPFPGKDTDWIWLFNAIPDNHWKWFRREGFSLHRSNDDYWNFLIPGVGEAPVVSFLLLVSLFAVVIGPVNYVLLNRARRLYLLLITVPAGAALITVCLIAYALLTDGLGVRLRSRSFVDLDQRTGRAAAWARQSYYASLTPSQGLRFPADTTVYPIVAEPAPRGGNSQSGTLVWDDGQNLRSGFLASRTTTQFMLQRATKSDLRLVVRDGQSLPQPPEVENLLSADALFVLLRDGRGDYYCTRKLLSKQKQRLAPADLAGCEKELEAIWQGVAPKTPDRFHTEFDRNNGITMLFMRNYGWNSGHDASAGEPLMQSSLLEAHLAESFLPTKHPLTPGSYTAIVEKSIVAPTGVARPREEASLHVIRGRY